MANAGSAGNGLMNEYQTWPHGYVSVATLCASRRALLGLLQRGPQSLDVLVAALCANHGHLAVAMRTLRVLQWVTLDDANRLQVSEAAAALSQEPQLHQLCGDLYAEGDKLVTLVPWIREATAGWPRLPADSKLPPMLRHLLSGAVLTVLLLELRARAKETGAKVRTPAPSLQQPSAHGHRQWCTLLPRRHRVWWTCTE